MPHSFNSLNWKKVLQWGKRASSGGRTAWASISAFPQTSLCHCRYVSTFSVPHFPNLLCADDSAHTTNWWAHRWVIISSEIMCVPQLTQFTQQGRKRWAGLQQSLGSQLYTHSMRSSRATLGSTKSWIFFLCTKNHTATFNLFIVPGVTNLKYNFAPN